MMLGTNNLDLSQESMVAAVQHWLENVLFKDGKAPRVESVTWEGDSRGYSSTAGSFVVKLAEPAKEAPKP